MKTDIHPTYFADAQIRCSCGHVVVTGSTKKELRTELCSNCHPFYTGQQKLVDTAGRVDKFQEKRKKATEKADEKKLRAEAKKKKPEVYKEKEVPEEVLQRALKGTTEKRAGKWNAPLGEAPAETVAKEAVEVSEKPAKRPRKAPVKKK